MAHHNLLVPHADAFEIKCGRDFYETLKFSAADAIEMGAMPTDEEVSKEAQRLHWIQYARNRGGPVSHEMYCDAIIRHHKVVSVRSGMGNDAILQAILDGQQQINARLNDFEARLNDMEARLSAVEAANENKAPSTSET